MCYQKLTLMLPVHLRGLHQNISKQKFKITFYGMKLLFGIHSLDLPGISCIWTLSNISISLFLITDIGADMSEHSEEPGIIIPFTTGEHLLSSFPITLFQIKDPLKTKFCLETSRFILGKHIKKFVILGLSVNSSNREIGVLCFTILNKSINVCWM